VGTGKGRVLETGQKKSPGGRGSRAKVGEKICTQKDAHCEKAVVAGEGERKKKKKVRHTQKEGKNRPEKTEGGCLKRG